METFLEWLNQRDPEYLFESAFAEQNSELIEETFGRRMGGRPIIAPRVNRPIIARRPILAPKRRRQSYAPVNRGYTQGGTQIPNMDPVTGRIIPDDVSPLTVDQADDRREPQELPHLDVISLMRSNVSDMEKQNRIKKFIADLGGDLRDATEDEIYAIAYGINNGILDKNIMPPNLASELMMQVPTGSMRDELAKLTESPYKSQSQSTINRTNEPIKQFPPKTTDKNTNKYNLDTY